MCCGRGRLGVSETLYFSKGNEFTTEAAGGPRRKQAEMGAEDHSWHSKRSTKASITKLDWRVPECNCIIREQKRVAPVISDEPRVFRVQVNQQFFKIFIGQLHGESFNNAP